MNDLVEFVSHKEATTDVSHLLDDMMDSLSDGGIPYQPCAPQPAHHSPVNVKEEEVDVEGEIGPDGYRQFRVYLIDANKNQVERAKVIGKSIFSFA